MGDRTPEATRAADRGRTGRRGVPSRTLRAVLAGGLTAALAAALTACSSSPAPEDAGPTSTVIVAMGDSYSVGYRPVEQSTASMTVTDDSFPNDLAALLTDDRTEVSVANFGCAGATSEDLVTKVGCDADRQAPGAPRYNESTQADAAEVYLQANRGRVEAVTLIIGGNDITSCFTFEGGTVVNDPSPCLYDQLLALRERLDALLPRLRTAAGPDVPIVGLTYPDVFLGLWVTGGPTGPDLATQSLDLFRGQLAPLLAERYAAVGARFVDLTDEFGADVPLTRTTDTAEWGVIPEAVAEVCEFTYACTAGDTHPTAQGHERIAAAIQKALSEPVPTPAGSGTATGN